MILLQQSSTTLLDIGWLGWKWKKVGTLRVLRREVLKWHTWRSRLKGMENHNRPEALYGRKQVWWESKCERTGERGGHVRVLNVGFWDFWGETLLTDDRIWPQEGVAEVEWRSQSHGIRELNRYKHIGLLVSRRSRKVLLFSVLDCWWQQEKNMLTECQMVQDQRKTVIQLSYYPIVRKR